MNLRTTLACNRSQPEHTPVAIFLEWSRFVSRETREAYTEFSEARGSEEEMMLLSNLFAPAGTGLLCSNGNAPA